MLAVALAAATASAQEGAATQSSTPTEKAVTPPKLVQFVEAEYPAAAVAAGLEADVDLALSIDAEGRVTAAEVIEARGHGFDEAAQAAALAFRFEPARRGDQAVAAKILYRYSFHLDRAPAEHPAAPAAVLRGRVEVSGGDAPLAGARIAIHQGELLVREIVSSPTGSWEVRDLAPGRYRLTLSADGFEDYTVTETLGADEEVTVTYRLVPTLGGDETTTIVVHGERTAREVTRRTITRREMSRVPGTSGDALRSIQNLPGVARPPSLSGVLVVRGTPPNSTPVFVEGMFLPNVYHLGGLSSVIPTELMEEINFYPGNYSVRFGRGLGGIVDVALRKTRDDGDYHGLLQLDLIDARAMLEGPVPGTDGWNFVAGFRRSHVDAWLVPLVDNEDTSIVAAPVYYDYQLFADKRLTKDSYLRVGFLGYDDRVRIIDRVAAEGGELDSIDNINGF
ncbi:MAG TPA: TonB family protein, partial [Polyangiaceae bacterium]|nr:TonB family protein [Polyangiaceae bacterium]